MMSQKAPSTILNNLLKQFESLPSDPLLGMTGCGAQALRDVNEGANCLLGKLGFVDRFERQDLTLKDQFNRLSFEKDVSSIYREISESFQELNRTYLPFVRTMRQSGCLHQLLVNLRDGSSNVGSVNVLALFRETLKSERLRDELERAGVTRNLGTLIGRLEDTKVQYEVVKDQLYFSIVLNGETSRIILNIHDQKQQPESIRDLLHRDDADHLFRALSAHGSVNAVMRERVALDQPLELNIDRILIGTAIFPVFASHQRARSIEDVGLPSYQGNQGWDVGWFIVGVIAAIAAAVLLTSGVVLLVDCLSSGGDCTVAGILLGLGILAAVVSVLSFGAAYGGIVFGIGAPAILSSI